MALPTYLSVEEATALAAQLPGLASFKAANDAEKLAALKLATDRFDTARRYQGRKYAIDGTQALEFPRLPYADAGTSYDSQVWDWDWDNKVAIIPPNVKRAVLFEADSILAGVNGRLREKRFSGLLSQSVGSLSESYQSMMTVQAANIPSLCWEADRISRMYALRSGQML